MLKKTTVTKICQHLKIDQAKLEAALADKAEVEVEVSDDLQVFTKAELTQREKNQYDIAKKAGEEMLVKAAKQKHGIDIAGEDIEKFIEALQVKIAKELNLKPDAQVAQMQQTLDQAKAALKKANDEATGFKTQMEQLQADTELINLLPADRAETMTTEEYLALTKSKIKIEVRDGKKVVVKDGQPVIDAKTMEPIAPAEALKGYFTERKWLRDPVDPTKGGRGGGNSDPTKGVGKFTKLSQINEHVAKSLPQGQTLTGEDAQRQIMALIKENDGVDLKS